MKQKTQHGPIRTRTRDQLPRLLTNGKAVKLICPFCKEDHELLPGLESECGTMISVRATQTVFISKDLTCVKCGVKGGGFVRFQGGYVHNYDCKPGTHLLSTPPRLNRLAGWVIKWPEGPRHFVERFTGRASALEEIDDKGVKTGVILGHFFFKGENHGRKNSQLAT